MFDLINKQFKFSLYKNLYSVKAPDGELDANELIEIIKYGYIKKDILHLRKQNGEAYKKSKMMLPSITTSGIFTNRNSQSIKKHNGLIQIDIDEVEDYDYLYHKICNNQYTYICFRSPGGKGIKVIVKINPNVDTHLEQFNALELYFKKEYQVEIDSLCKDVSRCMLLSYDPFLYCNPFSEVFEELYTPIKKEIAKEDRKIGTWSSNTPVSKEKNTIEDLIKELRNSKIDITEEYKDWINIGYALCSSFDEGGRKYYHEISEHYPNYNYIETDKQYNVLLKKNNGKTRIGTLLFIAKKYGVKTRKEIK